MGIYKSQYENYYRNLRGNNREKKSTKIIEGYEIPQESNTNHRNSIDYLADNGSGRRKKEGIGFWNLFIFQCIGSLLILVIFIIFKAIPGEEAQKLIMASKNIISENQIDTNNILNFGDIKEVAYEYVDGLRELVGGEGFLEETVKGKYIAPIKGEIKENNGKIYIYSKEKVDVKASYDGKVKEVKDNNGISAIIINHGEGIETFYNYVSSSTIKKGDEIKKGQVIGISSDKLPKQSIGIEYGLIYMGDYKAPKDYMDFKETLN